MAKCELCDKETGKEPEKAVGVDYHPATGKETLVPYTMPLYCDECLKDLEALADDEKDMAQIAREWRAYL